MVVLSPATRPGSTADAESLSVGMYTPAWPARHATSGIVTYVDRLRAALIDCGVDVSIIAGNRGATDDDRVYGIDPRGTLRNLYTKLGRRLAPDRFSTAMWRETGTRIAGAITASTASMPIDVFEMEESYGFVSQVADTVGAPVVVHLHGPHFIVGTAAGNSEIPRFALRCKAERKGILAASAVRVNSRATLDLTQDFLNREFDLARVIQLPLEVAPESMRWSLDECERNSILFVGRFDRLKGGDLVIDAFSRLANKYPDAELSFAGVDRGFVDDQRRTWSIGEYIADRIDSPSVRARINVLGMQTPAQLEILRRRANVVAVASRFETFGYTAAEAMATGCPVIVTNAGGLPEVVTADESGLVVEKDSAEALADGIARVFEDESLARKLGAAALVDCERRFAPRVIAEQSIEFYRKVVESGLR